MNCYSETWFDAEIDGCKFKDDRIKNDLDIYKKFI